MFGRLVVIFSVGAANGIRMDYLISAVEKDIQRMNPPLGAPRKRGLLEKTEPVSKKSKLSRKIAVRAVLRKGSSASHLPAMEPNADEKSIFCTEQTDSERTLENSENTEPDYGLMDALACNETLDDEPAEEEDEPNTLRPVLSRNPGPEPASKKSKLSRVIKIPPVVDSFGTEQIDPERRDATLENSENTEPLDPDEVEEEEEPNTLGLRPSVSLTLKPRLPSFKKLENEHVEMVRDIRKWLLVRQMNAKLPRVLEHSNSLPTEQSTGAINGRVVTADDLLCTETTEHQGPSLTKSRTEMDLTCTEQDLMCHE